MKNEQREAIDRLNKDKKCSLDYERYITIVRVADLDAVLSLIKEQEKQIDLMAEHIVSSAIIDDTVCAIKCDCESDILEDCSHEKMLNCTKQYFETKAKKGE